MNVRSLVHKISELRFIATKTRAVVISLSETWLDESVLDSEMSISDYCLVRCDRNRNGGGVCLYIRNDIPFSQRLDLGSDDLELLCCDILLPKTRPIVVGACYRPPKQNDFFEKLEEELFKIRTDSEIYLLGDFNICFFQKCSNLCKKYLDVLRMFNLTQLITEATRVTSSSSSLIDHILSNSCEKICQSGTISIGLSDHFLTFMTRKVVKGQISKHNFVKIRSLKHYNKDNFNLQLSDMNWEGVFCALMLK